jgi:hypothetical protein
MMFIRICMALCLGLVGCSKSSNQLGHTSQALDAGTSSFIVSNANSPSIVPSGTHLALSFTGTGSSQLTRWGSFDGTTWAFCDVATSSCNNGVGVTGPSGLMHWLGQGAVAADGNGNVVMVTLANNQANTTPNWVVALVSTNDGKWYTKTGQLVNESGGECDPATEDLPDITVDQTTTPATFWFVWRHNGAGNFGGCVRRGVLDANANINWLDEVRSVGGMDKEDDGSSSEGQGGLRIAAGDGVVSIGYSNNDSLVACPSTTMKHMAWGSVSSYDNGVGWTATSVAYHTDNFLFCPFGSVQNSIRAFDFIRSQDGNYYLAVADWNSGGTTATMHLFMNEGSSAALLAFPSDSHVWREFCPGVQDTPDGGPMTGAPAGNWTRPGTLCTNTPPPFATDGALMFPTLASDGQNRVALLHYKASSTSNFHPVWADNITPRTSSSTFAVLDPLGSNVSSPGSHLGTHCAMTAWSSQSPDAGRADSCSATGDFYPVWVESGFLAPYGLGFDRVSP